MINADALIEKLEAWKKEAERRNATINYTFASAIIAQVNAEPTIEERNRGEWIEDAGTFYNAVNEKGGGVNEDTPFFTEDDVACSECLTLFNVLENRTDIFDFCPNCGADMKGEQE